MEINYLIINFFSGIFLALFTIGLISNFKIAKFLNLSYGSFFALGAYVAYHFFLSLHLLSILILLFISSIFGILLYVLLKKIGNDVLSSTIVSLGLGILIEEILRLTHVTGYFLILDVPIKVYEIAGVKMAQWELVQFFMLITILTILYALYKSKYGIKIKFVEEDVELATIYGVNINVYQFSSILLACILSSVLGFLSSTTQAIFPSMGWGVLVSGIIVLAIASQFRLVGFKQYLVLAIVSIAYTEIIGWF